MLIYKLIFLWTWHNSDVVVKKIYLFSKLQLLAKIIVNMSSYPETLDIVSEYPFETKRGGEEG